MSDINLPPDDDFKYLTIIISVIVIAIGCALVVKIKSQSSIDSFYVSCIKHTKDIDLCNKIVENK